MRREYEVATTKELISLLQTKGYLIVPPRALVEGPLTERETILSPYVVAGKSDATTATHCNLSQRMVKAAVVGMLRRYACRDRTQLAAFLSQRGF